MRFVFISDTHMAHHEINIPDGDVLIHSGDATYTGSVKEVASFGNWFQSLPHKTKIFVAGNHDWLFERERSLAEGLMGDVICLQDSATQVGPFKIWGSPVQPWFCDWAFNRERGEDIKKHWDLIPPDTDILVTHGPPYNILDKCLDGSIVGCMDLLQAINRVKPKIHAFGHIHPGFGVANCNGTQFINASIMDDDYNPVNHAIVVDLNAEGYVSPGK